MLGRDVKQNPKSEYRNPKQTETRKTKIQNPKRARLEFSDFDHLNLFRISDFVLRIFFLDAFAGVMVFRTS
jgi:hypothetical protein